LHGFSQPARVPEDSGFLSLLFAHECQNAKKCKKNWNKVTSKRLLMLFHTWWLESGHFFTYAFSHKNEWTHGNIPKVSFASARGTLLKTCLHETRILRL
jgi:hypothetical protein